MKPRSHKNHLSYIYLYNFNILWMIDSDNILIFNIKFRLISMNMKHQNCRNVQCGYGLKERSHQRQITSVRRSLKEYLVPILRKCLAYHVSDIYLNIYICKRYNMIKFLYSMKKNKGNILKQGKILNVSER